MFDENATCPKARGLGGSKLMSGQCGILRSHLIFHMGIRGVDKNLQGREYACLAQVRQKLRQESVW